MQKLWQKNSKAIIVLTVVLFLFASVFGVTRLHANQQEDSGILGDNYYIFTSDKFFEDKTNIKPNAYVLNFYADWCTSCSGIDHTIIDVMSELGIKENVHAYRVNFGDSSETVEGKQLANNYGVITNSTVLVLNSKDDVIGKHYGVVDRDELRNQLELAARLNFQ